MKWYGVYEWFSSLQSFQFLKGAQNLSEEPLDFESSTNVLQGAQY